MVTVAGGENVVDAGPRRLTGDLPEVGPLALGVWRLVDGDTWAAQNLVETALDVGLTLVDAADVYGLDWGGAGFGSVEEGLGRVLAAAPHLRDRMVLATKGGIVPGVPYDSSPAHLRAACEASLRRLGVDVIDLWMIHRPDPFTHPAAVAETLAGLRDAGLIRAAGVSNHTPAQVDALAAHLPFPLATNQVEYSARHLDPLWDGTFDQCVRTGVVPMAWGPLGGGALVRPPGPGHPGGLVRPQLLEVLDWLAGREGVDRAAVALAFVLAHPARPVAVLGSVRPERVTAATAALRVHLDRSDVYDVIEASQGTSLP